MIARLETIACRTRENIASLFLILGDSSTSERCHRIRLHSPLPRAAEQSASQPAFETSHRPQKGI